MQTARAPPSKHPFVNLNININSNFDTNHNATDESRSTQQGHYDTTITMAKKKATRPSLSKRLGIAYMSNRQTRLLSLPAELRISIWECVCAGTELNINVNPAKGTNSRKHKVGILGVCKQIREEIAPIYFGFAVFKLEKGPAVQSKRGWVAGLAYKHAWKLKRICVVPSIGKISEDAVERQLDVEFWEMTQSNVWICSMWDGLDLGKSDVELELRLPDGKTVRTNDPKTLLMEQ